MRPALGRVHDAPCGLLQVLLLDVVIVLEGVSSPWRQNHLLPARRTLKRLAGTPLGQIVDAAGAVRVVAREKLGVRVNVQAHRAGQGFRFRRIRVEFYGGAFEVPRPDPLDDADAMLAGLPAHFVGNIPEASVCGLR